MGKQIGVGDKVKVYWGNNSEITGIVISVPRGWGDSWQVENEIDSSIWVINVYASHFEAMVRYGKHSET